MSSFIVTMDIISFCVHFSALITDTPATFGSATPTKHEWPLQCPHHVNNITSREMF